MWSAILTVGLQLLGWFLEKSAADKETKEKFFEWVKLAGNDFGSVKLLEYGDAALKKLKSEPWKETK